MKINLTYKKGRLECLVKGEFTKMLCEPRSFSQPAIFTEDNFNSISKMSHRLTLV